MMTEEKEKTPAILVSACLLGVCCKYDGGSNLSEKVLELKERYQIIPVCPEQLGGLVTPRTPAERSGQKVITKDGRNVTEQFLRGAQETLKLAQIFGCQSAVLKERSPSCGCDVIYDGTFTGTKISGDGVTAELLKKNGIQVYTEQETECLLREL